MAAGTGDVRRRDSVKDRRKCFDDHRYIHADGSTVMDCHICGGVIRPGRGQKWVAEHVIPLAFDGADVRPAHESPCHTTKTAKDVGDIAKAKRVQEKHFGIRQRQGFRKPPPGFKYDWGKRRLVKVEEMDD